ncbi:Uncharacterised protein [Burkholderia pseudomallei]|nr:Uncharacterised protein [Burkholderia pseudomallei]
MSGSNLFHIQSMTFDDPTMPQALASRRWDIAVTGNPDVDVRSNIACAYAKAHAARHFSIQYTPHQISVDGNVVHYTAMKSKFRGAKNLLIEATAMTCPEILFAMRAALELGITDISFLYLEPLEYRRRIRGRLTDHRDFDLSGNRRFRSVHGFMGNLTELPQGQAVFFLGYEKARLGQALEQEETLGRWQKHAVLGVPAFEPSWEIDAIANNVQHLASSHYQLQYAAASSVRAAYDLLNCLLQDDKLELPIVVAPLGTKPHTIGASLFLIEHNEFNRTVLLYDHPSPLQGRSTNVRRWHIHDVCSASSTST